MSERIAAHPIKDGVAPERLPISELYTIWRLIHMVYWTTYRKKHKSTIKAAIGNVIKSAPHPATIIAITIHRTALGLITPVTVGLIFVLSIIASISRSYKLLKAPAAPIIRAVPRMA